MIKYGNNKYPTIGSVEHRGNCQKQYWFVIVLSVMSPLFGPASTAEKAWTLTLRPAFEPKFEIKSD
jgi:hypothetical protein